MALKKAMLHEIQGYDFPDYEFRPYPKWVEGPDGKKVIVQNVQDEVAVKTGRTAEPETAVSPEAVVNSAVEKHRLEVENEALKAELEKLKTSQSSTFSAVAPPKTKS